MSYLVLARKFRPQTFAFITGQEHITLALANAIVRNRVPHALLFTGPRGVGKTTSARVFARALNCTGREVPKSASEQRPEDVVHFVEPCGQCSNCVEIARSSSMAVWEIDGASHNSVENVRDLIDSLRSVPPPGSEYKIYIIDEVHMLSVAAFNALLKSLEEPPPQTIFIFATTEPHKIPETVISRCQRHDFRRLSSFVIRERLVEIAREEGVDIEPEAIAFVARRAQGGMRDAQSMLDRLISFGYGKVELATAQQIFGVLDNSFFFKLSEAVIAQEATQCFLMLDQAFSQSLDIRLFAADFLTHWRNLLLISVTQTTNASDEQVKAIIDAPESEFAELKKQAAKLPSFDWQRLFDIAERTCDQALRSTFPRYVLEAGAAKMAALSSLRPLPEILSRLEGGAALAVVPGTGSPAGVMQSPPSSTPLSAVQQEPVSRPATGRSPSLKTQEPEATEPSLNFNPSWHDFLAHVKSRKAVVLEACLRRVSPKSFVQGMLQLEARPFDMTVLRDADSLASLKECLFSYSGRQGWEIRFLDSKGEHGALESHPAQQAGAGVETERRDEPLTGSVAAAEALERKLHNERVESEAKSDPLVQSALSTFGGSTIDKVVVLK